MTDIERWQGDARGRSAGERVARSRLHGGHCTRRVGRRADAREPRADLGEPRRGRHRPHPVALGDRLSHRHREQGGDGRRVVRVDRRSRELASARLRAGRARARHPRRDHRRRGPVVTARPPVRAALTGPACGPDRHVAMMARAVPDHPARAEGASRSGGGERAPLRHRASAGHRGGTLSRAGLRHLPARLHRFVRGRGLRQCASLGREPRCHPLLAAVRRREPAPGRFRAPRRRDRVRTRRRPYPCPRRPADLLGVAHLRADRRAAPPLLRPVSHRSRHARRRGGGPVRHRGGARCPHREPASDGRSRSGPRLATGRDRGSVSRRRSRGPVSYPRLQSRA